MIRLPLKSLILNKHENIYCKTYCEHCKLLSSGRGKSCSPLINTTLNTKDIIKQSAKQQNKPFNWIVVFIYKWIFHKNPALEFILCYKPRDVAEHNVLSNLVLSSWEPLVLQQIKMELMHGCKHSYFSISRKWVVKGL